MLLWEKLVRGVYNKIFKQKQYYQSELMQPVDVVGTGLVCGSSNKLSLLLAIFYRSFSLKLQKSTTAACIYVYILGVLKAPCFVPVLLTMGWSCKKKCQKTIYTSFDLNFVFFDFFVLFCKYKIYNSNMHAQTC